ncbi:5-oxoprolinase subunit PxpA [Lutibacter sp.]|uniref:5-oxoprolinase subunit PxpA n=1 Tax=Lutibacter sp. TaxID=1925666 RepID=UPI002737583D|nr:5-oxoprolinase subunit PxpA [Lutibacter sp.]MDP3313373.1 5-oxoprolinase subunit PxpA [Lutibacter sp.]
MVRQKIDINCDLGEGFDNEPELMPFIQSCNIACGGHAGDVVTMEKVVKLAMQNNVHIGAHPSYPDKGNFGRKSIIMNEQDFKNIIQNQVNSLQEIINKLGRTLYHIKPHGALYNDIFKDAALAHQFLNAVLPYKNFVKLIVPFNSEIEKIAIKNNFAIIYEAFADRSYNSDLSLVSRNKPNAVLTNLEEILNQVKKIYFEQKVKSITGDIIPIKATTFCVHSDTPNAIEIVKYLHANLKFE